MAKANNKGKKNVVKKPAAKKAIRKPAKASKKTGKTSKKTAPKKAAKKGKRKPETLMCFLTTACVNYFGLANQGYELNTLRNYRDTYLALIPGGKKLISDYYAISPLIVEHMNKDKEKNKVYEYIYTQVQSACSEIEKRKLRSAKNVYTQMVNTLAERYHLN